MNRLFKSILLTSVPMLALSYLYGLHGLWIWIIAFFMGMCFQADISLKEFSKIIKQDVNREIKYWKCRFKRHPLKELPEHFKFSPYADNYSYCEECESLIRK